MKFSKLSHQLLIVFAVVIILSLGISGWVVTALAQRIVTNNILESHQLLAQRIADEISLQMKDIRALLLFLAEAEAIRSMDPAGATKILTDYQARFPIFTRIYVVELSGEQIARTDEQPQENIAGTYGFQIAQQGRELISDVYLSEDEQALRLTIFRPITKNPDLESAGQITGVLVAEVSLSWVQAILPPLTLPADETVIIFAPNEQVIAHNQGTESAKLPALTGLTLMDSSASEPAGLSEIYLDKSRQMIVGIYPKIKELRWKIVVQTPLSKLDTEVAAIRRTMILGLLAGIALVIIASWLVSKRMAKPIEQLAWAAERVAGGDLSVSINMAYKELGRLSSAFNQMVANIRHAHETFQANENRLEQLVNLRTEELQIANQKLEQELAKHKETQKTLMKVLDNTEILHMTSRSLVAVENLPDLLQNLVDSIARVLPADRVTLMTFNLETREINHSAKGGPGAADYVKVVSFDELWEGLSGWVLRELKPALSLKEEADPRESLVVQQRRVETNCGAIIVVPLLYREQIFGTITAINRPDQRNFDQADVGIMTLLANQAAVAIENTRLYEKTIQNAAELTTLYEIEKRITAILELDELLQIIAKNVVQLVDADKCLIVLIDTEKSELIKVMGYGYSQTQFEGYSYQEFCDGISGWVLRHKQPTLSNDIKNDKRNRGQALVEAQRSHSKSIAVVPLMIGQEVKGTLTVINDEHKRAFTEDDLHLVTRLAGQVAMAIHNGRLYEAAKEADRLKSAFLATMSHELRTPLNSIIGFTGIMLQGLAGPLNEEQTRQLGMVSKSAQHLLALINDVLDISKIEAGQLKVSIEPVDVRQAIQKAIQIVTPLAEKKGLALVTNILPEVGWISSDKRRVEQIIINLVNNAIKFTDQGEVRLESEIHEDQVSIRVMDTGIGIKPEDMEELFKPFRQIDIGLARKREGTGLGLSICRRLVEILGGKIWVESEWGQGSVFTFSLPIGNPEANQEKTVEAKNSGDRR